MSFGKLNRHILANRQWSHNPGGMARCPFCDKPFANKGSMMQHCKSKHVEEIDCLKRSDNEQEYERLSGKQLVKRPQYETQSR